jgi:hypothetical protein
MNSLFVLLIIGCIAEDIYSPFKRTAVIQQRINQMYRSESDMEKSIKALEQQERDLTHKQDDLYKDMKYAVTASDRANMETQIEKIQKSVIELRKKKTELLRNLRRTSDRITQPFRDNIAREAGVDDRIGVENENTFIAERMRIQKKVAQVASKLGKKYAAVAAEIAALKAVEAKKKPADVQKETKEAYTKIYTLIVERVSKACEHVPANKVEETAEQSIAFIAEKLVHERALIPDNAEALAVAKKFAGEEKKAEKKEEKKAEKKEEKKAEKKEEKKTEKKEEKKAEKKEEKKEEKKPAKKEVKKPAKKAAKKAAAKKAAKKPAKKAVKKPAKKVAKKAEKKPAKKEEKKTEKKAEKK